MQKIMVQREETQLVRSFYVMANSKWIIFHAQKLYTQFNHLI